MDLKLKKKKKNKIKLMSSTMAKKQNLDHSKAKRSKDQVSLLTFKSLREYLREFHYCAGVFAGPFAGLFAGVPLVGYLARKEG